MRTRPKMSLLWQNKIKIILFLVRGTGFAPKFGVNNGYFSKNKKMSKDRFEFTQPWRYQAGIQDFSHDFPFLRMVAISFLC